MEETMASEAIPMSATSGSSRRGWKSTGAVLAGFVAVAGLSTATDQVLHVLEVYPPWGEPMYGAGLYLLALSYRTLFTILGGYLTARLAPRTPVRHVFALGAIGFVLGSAGAVVTVLNPTLGPSWYPIVLAL